jgi:hypothetical protein
MRQPLDAWVVPLDPTQPFRMGEDRDITCHEDIEKQILQPGRGYVMRRLHQHVARVSQGKKMTRAELRREAVHDVIVCAGDQSERDALLSDAVLQPCRRLPDRGSRILVEAR